MTTRWVIATRNDPRVWFAGSIDKGRPRTTKDPRSAHEFHDGNDAIDALAAFDPAEWNRWSVVAAPRPSEMRQ